MTQVARVAGRTHPQRHLHFVGATQPAEQKPVVVFGKLRQSGARAALRERAAYEEAWSLQQAGREADALATFKKLLDAFPKSAYAADANYSIAEGHYRNKRFKEALEAYEKALSALTGERLKDSTLYRLGWCRWSLGEYDAAAQHFDRLAAECPTSPLLPDAYLQAGEAYLRLGKPAEAIPRLEKIGDARYEKFEHIADARFRLGEAQLLLGRHLDALTTLTALEVAHPNYPAMAEVLFHMGKGFYELKRHDEARKRFDRVRGLTTSETAAKAQFYLGETYLAEGKNREALKAYFRVLVLWSSYDAWVAAAQYEIGKIYLREGNREEARKAFQTILEKHADTTWAEPAKQRLEELAG